MAGAALAILCTGLFGFAAPEQDAAAAGGPTFNRKVFTEVMEGLPFEAELRKRVPPHTGTVVAGTLVDGSLRQGFALASPGAKIRGGIRALFPEGRLPSEISYGKFRSIVPSSRGQVGPEYDLLIDLELAVCERLYREECSLF